MFEDVEDALRLLRPVLAKLEADGLDGAEAARLVELFAEGEKLCAAGRAMASRRVEKTDLWRQEGFRSAAAWMASKAGMPLGHAIGSMEMARRLDSLPATAEAFRAGRISEAQAREVAAAAVECPAAEERLVDRAERSSLAELREDCRRVMAAAVTEETERYERIRRSRYLKSWTEPDGAFRLDARLTPDDGARLLAAVHTRRQRIMVGARAAGRDERVEAYGADALVDLARGVADDSGDGPAAMVHVRVDYPAFVRGFTVAGETCEVPGLGPIPVAVARRLADDSILKVIVTDGVAITAVAHAGRTIPAHLRTALEARDPRCIVPHCHGRGDLQIDHRIPFAEGGTTTLDNLARLCRWHHYQKSHLGYRYRGGPGNWAWIAPDEPTEPPNVPP